MRSSPMLVISTNIPQPRAAERRNTKQAPSSSLPPEAFVGPSPTSTGYESSNQCEAGNIIKGAVASKLAYHHSGCIKENSSSYAGKYQSKVQCQTPRATVNSQQRDTLKPSTTPTSYTPPVTLPLGTTCAAARHQHSTQYGGDDEILRDSKGKTRSSSAPRSASTGNSPSDVKAVLLEAQVLLAELRRKDCRCSSTETGDLTSRNDRENSQESRMIKTVQKKLEAAEKKLAKRKSPSPVKRETTLTPESLRDLQQQQQQKLFKPSGSGRVDDKKRILAEGVYGEGCMPTAAVVEGKEKSRSISPGPREPRHMRTYSNKATVATSSVSDPAGFAPRSSQLHSTHTSTQMQHSQINITEPPARPAKKHCTPLQMNSVLLTDPMYADKTKLVFALEVLSQQLTAQRLKCHRLKEEGIQPLLKTVEEQKATISALRAQNENLKYLLKEADGKEQGESPVKESLCADDDDSHVPLWRRGSASSVGGCQNSLSVITTSCAQCRAYKQERNELLSQLRELVRNTDVL